MFVPAVSYEDFSTSNQATVALGGPWITGTVDAEYALCKAESQTWCGGYCLSCQVYFMYPSAYYPTFIANVSVNLADYGGATSLDFTWNYWPAYCGTSTPAGTAIPILSQVGDAKFQENFQALDYSGFYTNGYQWDNASKISHNGSTAPVRGSDPNIGYILLNISTTMDYTAQPHVGNLDFYLKGIGFTITTPLSSATTSSSSSTSTSSTSPSSTSSVSAGVVAGAVIGALALVALFILAVLLFRRRRRRHKKGENPVDDSVIFTEQVNQEAPIPLEVPVQPSYMATRNSAQPSSASSPHPTSFTRGSYGPPPIYGSDELLTGQDRPTSNQYSPELARFATANRDTISENLEARLQAAGYVPTENPSRLTLDEWRTEYGVTKLELMRLQNLYERNYQAQPQ